LGTRYLESLFNPSSIVVVGASERADNLGGMVLRNLLGGSYPGRMLRYSGPWHPPGTGTLTMFSGSR